jgi:hypothetical protein
MISPMALRWATNEKAGIGPPLGLALPKIPGHRASIMGDDNALLLRSHFQRDLIFGPSQACPLGIQHIDGRFARE